MQRALIHDLSDCNGRLCYVIAYGSHAQVGHHSAETYQARQNRLRRKRWADRQQRAMTGAAPGIEIFGG